MNHEEFKQGLLKAANSMAVRSSGQLRLVCKQGGKGQGQHYLVLDNEPLGHLIESYISYGPQNQQMSLLSFLAQIVEPIAKRLPKSTKAGRKRVGVMMARIEHVEFMSYEEGY